MKVLIIGGTSSVGHALKPLLSGFSEVITAGRKNCDIHIDLADPIEKIVIPPGIDTIVHTAAHFGGKSAEEIVAAETINVVGTLKLCQAAVEAKVKHFVFISSISANLKETAVQYNIYALSKRHAEEATEYFCSALSLPLTILRPSQIYGSQDSLRRHQPFFYTMIDTAAKGNDITLYGSNDPRRNYIHIEDLANIIAKVVQHKVEGSYLCAQMEDVTYSQIAKAAFAAFNNKGSVYFLKDKPDIPDNIFDKDDTLYKKINFFPNISIEEGIKKIAEDKKK